MYQCPDCEFGVADHEIRCPRCETDLASFATLNELPDVQFNTALEAAGRGDYVTAMNLLGAAIVSRPADAEAWMLAGLIHARSGSWPAARRCCNMVRMLKPGYAGAAKVLQAIDASIAQDNAATATADPDTAPRENSS